MANDLEKLIRELTQLKRQVVGMATTNQLNHSSLDNSTIIAFDEEGKERLHIGLQNDGTHTVKHVDGPPPPQPTTPVVVVDGPVLRVTWDGSFTGGQQTPEDFSHIDVHVATAEGELIAATITAREGSAALVKATKSGTHTVTLVARSLSGKLSPASDPVVVDVAMSSFTGAIEAVAQSANGKNNVTYSSSRPTAEDHGVQGDTWWVNESRLRDPENPESDQIIQIIEQWQYTGDSWVQVELAHEVIASIDLGTATVGYLQGQRIVAATIDTEQLKSTAIDGMVITGSTFRTSADFPRVEINQDGLKAFNNSGNLTLNADSHTGDISVVGNIATDIQGNLRVNITDSVWENRSWLDWEGVPQFTNGTGIRIGRDGGSLPRFGEIAFAEIFSKDTTNVEFPKSYGAATGRIGSANVNPSQEPTFMMLAPSPSPDRARLSLYGNNSGDIRVADGKSFTIRSNSSTQSYIRYDNGEVFIRGNGGGGAQWAFNGSTHIGGANSGTQYTPSGWIDHHAAASRGHTFYINNEQVGVIRSKSYESAGGIKVGDQTGSSTANAQITAGGWIVRQASSSRRYKTRITAAQSSYEALLSLQPVTFCYKTDIEKRRRFLEGEELHGPDREIGSREPEKHYGLIAEQVHELGLTDLVIYDDQGKVESVKYDRLAVALLDVVKNLDARMKEIEHG